jgi:hypothetical protein
VVGCHAEGEIGDVVVGGVLPPAGATMYDKMRTMERCHDAGVDTLRSGRPQYGTWPFLESPRMSSSSDWTATKPGARRWSTYD